MKAIELTEEHKSKLLEMCKELFPKHEWSFRNDLEDEGMIDIDIRTRNFKMIHWFEFCMTYLAKKVCKSDGVALTFKDDNNNIIEFLYEEFKKLKQE